jgi:AsmA family protein
MGKLIKILVVIVLLAVAAIAGVIFTIDFNQFKPQIVKAVKDNTGRDFEISGELKLAPSLIPTVAIEGVSLGNASWSKEKTMLSVGKFEAQVALMPLLKKNIQVNRIILIEPNIHLETNKDGIGNWVFKEKDSDKKADAKDAAPADMPSLNINEVVIEKANLTYIDGVTGTTQKLSIDELSVQAGSFNKPLNLVLEASYNDIPISASGKFGSINSLTENKEFAVDFIASVNTIEIATKGMIAKPKDAKGIDVVATLKMDSLAPISDITKKELPAVGPINVTGKFMEKDGAYSLSEFKANIDKTSISGNGKITDPKNLKGVTFTIDLNSPSLSDLNTLAKSELPDMAPLSFSGTISDESNAYKFKSFKLQVGDINVSGDASINISGERPALTANLSSDSLDITPFQGEEKEKVKKDKLFSSDPLPLEGLKAADVALAFKTKKLITKDLTISDAEISLDLNNGKLKLSKTGKAAGGSLAVNVDLDGSNGKTAILNNKIEIKQLELGQIPSIQEKKLITGGKTDVTINAKGSGESVSQIMAGLNGKLLVQTGKGQLSNSALELASADALMSTLSMLTPGSKESEGSLLECAVVNFDIKDGLATAENGIAMSTNHISVIGAGTIDFKTEKLDIGITPKAKQGIGLNLGQLAGLVRVGGTLANPQPKADAEGALKTGITAGAAVATGGLSLLAENLLSKGVDDGTNPCDIAMGKAPVKSAAKEKPAEEKNVVEKTTDTVKDAAGAIGDKLKSLF